MTDEQKKKSADELEAVRAVAQLLEPFDEVRRERILRWARELVGMAVGGTSSRLPAAAPTVAEPPAYAAQTKDIQTFMKEKTPKDTRQLAAVVAFYHRFVAPDSEQKETITGDDIVDACRKANWRRPGTPGQALIDAYHAGLLDRAGRGQYRLNTVGENLVAMVLPGGEQAPASAVASTAARKGGVKKGGGRKTARKGAAKKAPKKTAHRSKGRE